MSDSTRIYPPTQQHLRKLRERGLSARSTSFIQAVGFLFAAAGAYVCWPSVARYMNEALSVAIQSADQIAAGRGNILDACWVAAGVFVRASLSVCLATSVGCCAAALLHMKPQVTARLAAPSLDRINPFRRAQSTTLAGRAYRGLALNLICCFCMAFGLWYRVGPAVAQLWAAGFSEASFTASAYAELLADAVVAIAGCALVFGVIDLLLQKHDFSKQSRMTYNEKLEDDRMQEQPAWLARELKLTADSLEGGLGRVREAAVVARNPTHLAVGVAYTPDIDQPAGRAPRIVCKGSGRYASQILDRAASYGFLDRAKHSSLCRFS
jgi:flagellar biosynthesis protein FlhB